MAELNLDKNTTEKLQSFMKGGKIRVFECGEKRPEYIQDRPFFGLLPSGQTTFIEPGLEGENCTISVGEPSKDYILDTDNHRFFKQIEERFRNVRPDMTLFVIDPDVVMGRYAADGQPNRSVGKSLYLHIVEKLLDADAYGKAPIDEQYVPSVIESAILSSNAFSSTAPVNVTKKNLEGDRNISLVVGDNPDTLVDDMFQWVPGVKERMKKEGVTRRQLQQFTLYHEFGHALDLAHKGGFTKEYTRNNVDAQLARHRTECLADAHAVLQLARDYGQTDISVLIGDVRIETMHRIIKKYSKKESSNPLERAIDQQSEENLKVSPSDTAKVAEVKTLQSQSERFEEIKSAGANLAYYTTGVVDAAIKIAQQKLADGSLMKMKDVEVLDLADQISQKYGLSKEEMTQLRVDLVDHNPNPVIDQMEKRTEEAFSRMPISREKIEKMYEKSEKSMQKRKDAQIEEALGIIKAPEEPAMTEAQMLKIIEKMEAVADWRLDVFDKIAKRGADKDALISVLTEEKEAVRKASLKDPIGAEKMQTLNEEFIDQAPVVLTKAKANQAVFKQLQKIPAKSDVLKGDDAVVAFFAHEISSMDRMSSLLRNTAKRDTASLTVDEQMSALDKDRTEYTKILLSERMAQLTAVNICKDEKNSEKIMDCPSLAVSVIQKAQQKHPEWMTDYQMMFSSPNPDVAKELVKTVEEQKFTLVSDMANSKGLIEMVCEKKPALMKQALEFAQGYMEKIEAQQRMEAKAPKIDFKKLTSLKNVQR